MPARTISTAASYHGAAAGGGAGGDWSSIASQLNALTNLADINRLLHETVAFERSIEAELDRELGRRIDLERSILQLNATTTEMLELIRADAEQLYKGVAATALTADRIGSRVRRLDQQQTNVTDTLELINLILDRTHCVSGVQQAMAAQDYDGAAQHIARFLALEQRLSPAVTGTDAGQVEEQRQLLLSAKAQLESVVNQKLEEAVSARDHSAVLRFVLLHQPLALPDKGISRYIDYTRLVLGGKARELYQQLDTVLEPARPAGGMQGPQPTFIDVLSGLFRAVALAVEQDESAIVSTFGAAALLDVVVGVQAECDSQGLRMLQRFVEARRIAQLVNDAASKKRSGAAAAAAAAENRANAKVIELLIQELVLLVQRSEEYTYFLTSHMRDAVTRESESQQAAAAAAAQRAAHLQRRLSGAGPTHDAATAAGGGKDAAVLDPASAALQQHLGQAEARLRSGPFAVGVRELLGHYMVLEEQVMEDTSDMAIRIDELVPGSLTSSMVDDVFFILKKSSSRALATQSIHCACAILGQVNDLLANKFKGAVTTRLAGGPQRLLAAVPAIPGTAEAAAAGGAGAPAGAPQQAAAAEHATAINNIDVAAEYIQKLRQELEGHTERLFAAQSDQDRLHSVLIDMTKTASDFRAAANKALEAVADGLLPRMRPILDELGATSFQLSESDYCAGELGATWVLRLAAALECIVTWVQPLLTPACGEALTLLLLDKLVAMLEVLLGRKTFSQLGGLQLDKDVRSIVAAAGELTTKPVRDKFARLTQMAIVLSLESVEEFLDYWGDDTGHITWRLTPAEVKGVLGQRSDFNKATISALPL